jgi:hypothetical protein
MAAGVLYLAVLAITSLLVAHPVRPLFEGIGPTAAYRWVNPPHEFGAGNQPPTPLKTTIPLGPVISLNTSDAQVILNVAQGAIPAHDPDTQLNVAIDPLDPATLGPPQSPLRADGNAYRVDLSYAPSNASVGRLSTPGNLVVQVPEPAETILFSTDGHVWQRLDSHTAGQVTLEGTTFAQPGYYLAATSAPAARPSGGGTTWPAYAALLGTIGLAAVLGGGTQLRRRRKPATRAQQRDAARRAARTPRKRRR